MPKLEEVRIPDFGAVEGVTVSEVLVGPGDLVVVDAPVVVLESDKASMEVPSPLAGTIKDLRVSVGDEVEQGTVIFTLEVAEAERLEQTSGESSPPEQKKAEPPKPIAPPALPPNERSMVGTRPHASPGVRRFARKLGVDLLRVQGTGPHGRILKQDVESFVQAALEPSAPPPSTDGSGFVWPQAPSVDFSLFGPIETMELSRIRRLSAANLHRSWLHAPHVTQFDEADITELEAFRKAHVEEAKKRGFKLTPLAFLLKAVAYALKEFPEFNASLDPGGGALVLKKYFHIGVAVDTPNGLVVPVIRDVDKKAIFDLAEELAGTSQRARAGKLNLSDLQGGCFSISSLGGIGGTAFTPIINTPELAILGVSRSEMKQVWIDGEFVPRLMLPLSLSYDHRVIDGAAAARFIVSLGGLLRDIRHLLL